MNAVNKAVHECVLCWMHLPSLANGKMPACSVELVGFRFRYKVRDRVGIRVSDGVRVSTFYFRHTRSPHARILPITAIICCN